MGCPLKPPQSGDEQIMKINGRTRKGQVCRSGFSMERRTSMKAEVQFLVMSTRCPSQPVCDQALTFGNVSADIEKKKKGKQINWSLWNM